MKLHRTTLDTMLGDEFSVEIRRWKREGFLNQGMDNCAAIYAYLQEGHPLFAECLKGEHFVPGHIPFHGGCTYFEVLEYNGRKTIKIGCDYQHLCDEWMAQDRNAMKAFEVLIDDARDLHTFLSSPHCAHEDWAELDIEAGAY